MLSNYKILDKIGEGSYGVVHSAIHIATNKQVAIKRSKPHDDPSMNEIIESTTIREISLLKELNHPNIIGLYDVFYDADSLCMVMEVAGNDLFNFIDSTDELLSPSLVKIFLYQILCGIAHCHGCRVLHRDLKPANLLINNDGVLKIADFGLSRAFSLPVAPYTHRVVTLWYRAPELLLGAEYYSTPVDIWSIGCIFWQMATKSYLFAGGSEIGHLLDIFRRLGTPTNETWSKVESLPHYEKEFPKFKPKNIANYVPHQHNAPVLDEIGLDLLMQMLKYDPAERISAIDALKHQYFDELKPNKLPITATQPLNVENVENVPIF